MCARCKKGFECGIQLDGFNDVKQEDVLQFYETREIERDLSSATPSAVVSAASTDTD